MALRVLLADESSTIKKVMQLALQDYGVEVKAVPLGIDVLQVAKAFQPDIIFADVLLSKKSGYDVCQDLKSDKILKKTPLVLMWSGFLDIDEGRASQCGADRNLEKPFDAKILRDLVNELVPQTLGNAIAQYISFPEIPEIIEEEKAELKLQAEALKKQKKLESSSLAEASVDSASPSAPRTSALAPRNPAPPPPSRTSALPSTLSSEEFPVLQDPNDEMDEFQAIPLPRNKQKNSSFERVETDSWSLEDLSKFKVHIPDEDVLGSIGDDDITNTALVFSNGSQASSIEDLDKSDDIEKRVDSGKGQSLKASSSKLNKSVSEPFSSHQKSELDVDTDVGIKVSTGAGTSTLTEAGEENIDSNFDEFSLKHLSPNQKPQSPPPPPPLKNKPQAPPSVTPLSSSAKDEKVSVKTSTDSRNTENLREDGAAALASIGAGYSQERLEALVREHVREALETIAWKIIPDMAERVIREEIQKLVRELDKV